MNNPEANQPSYSPIWIITKFIFKFSNLIDLCAMLPIFLDVDLSGDHGVGTHDFIQLVQVIRILRLCKLLNFIHYYSVGLQILRGTLNEATNLLTVFLFIVLIIQIIFGCLICLCEKGKFEINSDAPHGDYYRLCADGTSKELSPFSSVGIGISWAIGITSGSGKIYNILISLFIHET